MRKGNESAAPVTKGELIAALGWSRPRLERRLEADPKFPVRKRGTQAGGWEFDLDAVVGYLDGKVMAQAVASVAAKTVTLPYVGDIADVPGAAHRGESTASQRLKNAQAARVEDSLRKARRELIEAAEMEIVLGTMLAHLGKALDSLADMVTKRLGLADEASDIVRGMVDGLRHGTVNDLKSLFAKPK